MAKEPKKKVVTKKDVSRLRKEQRQKRWIMFGAIVVLAMVAGVILFGLLYELVFEGMRAVATVEDDKISLNEFQKEVKYQRFQSVRTYVSYYQLYNALGPDMGQSFLSGLQQIQFRLSDVNEIQFGEEVLQQMIDTELIAQYAAANGISVSQEEIDESLQSAFGFFPDGTPTPEPTVTPFSTSTLTSEQFALVSPTPEFSPTAEETVEETAPVETTEPEETAAVTEEPAAEVTESPTPEPEVEVTVTATLEPIPTETPYTLEGYQDNLTSLADELDGIGLSQEYLEQKFKEGLLREKVYEIVTADLSAEQEQVWARHILVESEEIAAEVLQKLEAGEDWSSLAVEYSTDESNKNQGGDLGWFGTGQMVAPFQEKAFALEVGEVSEPVQTEFGWHIIQVLGHEVRPVNESEFEQIKQQQFTEWLDALREDAEISTADAWQTSIPDTPAIPPEYILDF